MTEPAITDMFLHALRERAPMSIDQIAAATEKAARFIERAALALELEGRAGRDAGGRWFPLTSRSSQQQYQATRIARWRPTTAIEARLVRSLRETPGGLTADAWAMHPTEARATLLVVGAARKRQGRFCPVVRG